MAKIRVCKEFTFDMAHVLHNYDGLCRNIHGHTYKMQVTLIGEPSIDKRSPKLGMVIDFSLLKKIVKDTVVDVFDHALVVSEAQGLAPGMFPFQQSDKFIVLPFQPTAENLVAHFAELILPQMPQGVKLHGIRLWETPTSLCEWLLSDNQ
jgi:6-pyruvoyltetrahydropterin/6-carboxytetrahydropterin synthase